MLFEKQTEAANQVIRLVGNIQPVHKTPTENNAPQVGVPWLAMKKVTYIKNQIAELNVFWVRAGLFGLSFHRYTWLFNAGKKTKRQSHWSKIKAKQ